jgi:hypothetical protein
MSNKVDDAGTANGPSSTEILKQMAQIKIASYNPEKKEDEDEL